MCNNKCRKNLKPTISTAPHGYSTDDEFLLGIMFVLVCIGGIGLAIFGHFAGLDR